MYQATEKPKQDIFEIVFLTRYRVFCDMTVVYEHIMVSMLLRINHTAVVTIFVSLV